MIKLNVGKFDHKCDYKGCGRYARILVLSGKYCKVHIKEIEGSYKKHDKILLIISPILLDHRSLSESLKEKVKE